MTASSSRAPWRARGPTTPRTSRSPAPRAGGGLRGATGSGAERRMQERVRAWQPRDGGVEVRTDRDRYTADRLIVTAGPWAGPILSDLGLAPSCESTASDQVQ